MRCECVQVSEGGTVAKFGGNLASEEVVVEEEFCKRRHATEACLWYW